MLRRKRRLELRRVEFCSRVLNIFQIICALIAVGRDLWVTDPQNISQVVGMIIFLPSLLLWIVARIQLGRCCTLLPVANHLVTNGIYAKFRNPVYIFGTLTMIGYFLFHGLPEGLLWLFLVIPIQYARSYKESIVLESRFGQEYQDYVRQTWI